jgi:hypothetical protein
MENLNEKSELHEVLIIDLENCPNQLNHLPNNLEKCLRVVICYAQSSAKVPLNWLNPLSAAITADKLKIVKMGQMGKNAADFGICFLAGALMQELPKETHFVIVSNDTDLDHAVRLLKEHGRAAERIGSPKEDKEPHLQPASTPQAPQNAQSSALSAYCEHLFAHSKNRPAQMATLLASIKNKFKNENDVAVAVYNALIARGVVQITENKVIYDDQKISTLAKS